MYFKRMKPFVEIVILIVVLSIFSKIFENNGLFDYVGDKFVQITKGKRILIIALLPTTIYVTSLFMNNLTVILLFTFICLQLSPIIGGKLIFAALALGILAGSSMLPWSATGGPVMLGEVNRFLMQFKGPESDVKK